jgi:hypothetical protein
VLVGEVGNHLNISQLPLSGYSHDNIHIVFPRILINYISFVEIK